MGAKLRRLVEFAGGKAVGAVKNEANKVIEEEDVGSAVVGKGNGGEDDAEVADNVGDVKPDGPVALRLHDGMIECCEGNGDRSCSQCDMSSGNGCSKVRTVEAKLCSPTAKVA